MRVILVTLMIYLCGCMSPTVLTYEPTPSTYPYRYYNYFYYRPYYYPTWQYYYHRPLTPYYYKPTPPRPNNHYYGPRNNPGRPRR